MASILPTFTLWLPGVVLKARLTLRTVLEMMRLPLWLQTPEK